MTDPLDVVYRQMLAETMRPCPEVPREERAREAARRQVRQVEEAVAAERRERERDAGR